MRKIFVVLSMLLLVVAFAVPVSAIEDETFRFRVEFTNVEPGTTFEYLRLDPDGNKVSDTTERMGESGIVECKASERIVFVNLESGTEYTVTELADSGYGLVYSSDSNGVIEGGQCANAQFVNQEPMVRMPETGGFGVASFYAVGIFLMLFGCGCLISRMRRSV